MGLRRQRETIREDSHLDKTSLRVGGSHLLELPDEDHQHSEMKDAREPTIQ
jgi:hypothetical protein